MPQNKLLSELSSTFRDIMFNGSKFLDKTPVLDTKYGYTKSQNNNLFYSFND